MAGTISPDRILHEMADLWVTLGKQGEGETGILRACSMTLVVAAEESDDTQAIGETLAALMPEHPSRAIVIRFRAGDQRALDARVFSQCWMPFGHRQQICCEQIEITASDASLSDVAAVLLPLKVPDLPVFLWCRSQRIFHLDAFPQLAAMAQKIVVDTAAFDDPSAAVHELAALSTAGRAVADLSWTRLTRWREIVAQIFENRAYLANLPCVSDIVIAHRGTRAPTTARYLAAWLLDGLARIGCHARVSFTADGGEPAWRLCRVELRVPDHLEPAASITLVEGRAAEIRTGGLLSKALLPALTDYALMREELSIPGRDPAFEHALAVSVNL